MVDIMGSPNLTTPPTGELVKDTTIETFQADVLEASMKTPVIVDFWATWCGPCQQLGPALEKAITARAGKLRMVKVDTDKNQMLAQQLRIQSLPTVMAFVAGRPVDGFQGALPASEIERFLDGVVQTAEQMGAGGEADQGKPDLGELLDAAETGVADGRLAEAMELFTMIADAAPEASPERARAYAGMARCAHAAGQQDQARGLVEMIPEAHHNLPAVSQAMALVSLGEGDPEGPGVTAALEEVETDPKSPGAHYRLGVALIDAGQVDAAMDALLTSVELDRDWDEAAARARLLKLFDAMGPTHPSVKSGRRRLSSLLFA